MHNRNVALLLAGVLLIAMAPALAQDEEAPGEREGDRPAASQREGDAPEARQRLEEVQRRVEELRARQREGRRGARRPGVPPTRIPALTLVDELDLSAEQREQVRELITERRQVLAEQRQQIAELRQEANAARREGDDEAADAAYQKLRDQLEDLNSDEQMAEQLREILTEEQRARFDAAMEDRERTLRQRTPRRLGEAPAPADTIERLKRQRETVIEVFDRRQAELERQREQQLRIIDERIAELEQDVEAEEDSSDETDEDDEAEAEDEDAAEPAEADDDN